MSWNWPHFTEAEMQCRCGCGGLPKDELMGRLELMRSEADFPFIVTSGFRCPEYNKLVADSGEGGPHTTGLAVDISVRGHEAFALMRLAFKHGMTGIGVKQKDNDRFLHFDCIAADGKNTRPWVWSY